MLLFPLGFKVCLFVAKTTTLDIFFIQYSDLGNISDASGLSQELKVHSSETEQMIGIVGGERERVSEKEERKRVIEKV